MLPGDLGGCSTAEFGMRPDRIVVEPPGAEDHPCVAQGGEQRFVEAFVAQPAVEAFAECILLRFAGSDVAPGDAAITASNSRATRAPDNNVSATMPKDSRLNWSTIARMRKRRLHTSASDTKSSAQHWFGPCGTANGARVPGARLRPPRRRTFSPSSW